MAVTINTTTIIIIIIVVTAAVIVVVDGFAIVVHTNIPPTPTLPPLPSSRSPTSTLSSTMEFKSLIPLSLSTTGTWQKGRNQRSLSLVTLRSTTSSTPKPFTTNNDENDNNDDTIISTTTKEKYLQLAQEAYTQYFSSSDTTFNAQSQNQQQQLHQQVMSLEEYLELAMEAWNAANNEGSAAGGQGISSRTTSSGRSDGGDGRNVVPILPIPNKFYASTTSTSSASSESLDDAS